MFASWTYGFDIHASTGACSQDPTYLPAREVQLSRAICTYLREIIDDNIKHLSHEPYVPEHVRLTEYINYHFHFDTTTVSFPEALRRGFSRRRPLGDSHMGYQCFHTAYAIRATHQYCQLYGFEPAAYRGLALMLDRELGMLTWEMLRLYFIHRLGQEFATERFILETRHV